MEMTGHANSALAVGLIASGVLACFLGYRLFKLVLGVSGFITGGTLAWTLLVAGGYGAAVTIVGALLGGLLGAVAMFSLFFVGVFLFGSALGLILAVVALSATGSEFNIPVVGISASVGGLVTLLFRKGLVVVATAVTGAWSLLCGVSYFVEGLDFARVLSEPNLLRSQGGLYYLFLALWALLGIGGIAVQLRTLRKKRKAR